VDMHIDKIFLAHISNTNYFLNLVIQYYNIWWE